MVRAPCCEKMGLKKGLWTTEEDQILIAYINKHGHCNWRALPKLAGLLRCGKSCRLRWINYLKPDIKRGNFTGEEEDTIIMLHKKMGNRWSAIASQLPGRTDNEIKNVWHTHLKKRLTHNQPYSSDTKKHRISSISPCDSISSVTMQSELSSNNYGETQELESSACTTSNSSDSSSSSVADLSSRNAESGENKDMVRLENTEDSPETVLPVIDDSFWSEASLDIEDSSVPSSNFTAFPDHEVMLFPFDSIKSMEQDNIFDTDNGHNGMEFWYDLFVMAGEPADLSEKF